MPLLVLLFIFIVVPLAELYVILQVGEAIGAPLTILILALDSIIGSLLLKSQGRAVWRRFNETMAAGRIPHREVLDGVMVIFGGAFLITPGFITDIVGILLLLPPTRVRDAEVPGPGARRALRDQRGGRRDAPALASRLRRRGDGHRGRSGRARAAGAAAAAVSAGSAELPVALSFFDSGAGVHGTIRSGLTLLFEGREARAERGPVEIEREGDDWKGRAGDDAEVTLAPVSDTADLGGIAVTVCTVEGRVGGRKIAGSGPSRRRAARPSGRSSTCCAPSRPCSSQGWRRSRSRAGRAGPRTTGASSSPPCWSRPASCARPRTRASRPCTTAAAASTAPGSSSGFRARTIRAGCSARVQAGTSLDLEGLSVHAAAFTWRMEGHVGAGLYELTLRRDDAEPAAA